MAGCVADVSASTLEADADAESSVVYDSLALMFRITKDVESPDNLVPVDVGFRDEDCFRVLLENELLLALSSKRWQNM
ncbi:unnamed protein product [Dibothriocephalus latus]|uniref:Uncharacterized protein n=1 Tax=Dibothriocephalus latus TaxID=60516 RepID=A0A3P7LI90_DIBLA|nr:unnamed protein product [Dibothriocephalus latus]